MSAEPVFDVVIFAIAGRVVEAVIGSGMPREKAEKRLLTGLSRVNNSFGVEIVAAANYKKGDLLPS